MDDFGLSCEPIDKHSSTSDDGEATSIKKPQGEPPVFSLSSKIIGTIEFGSSLLSSQSSSVRLTVGVARRKLSFGFKLLEQFFPCKDPDEQEFNGLKAKES